MKNLPRLLALGGILLIAILLAFPLRNAVYEVVIVPAAYLLWSVSLLYHSVNQSLWWVLALLVVLWTLGRSLLPQGNLHERVRFRQRPVVGQVEGLSVWMKRTEHGTYFKWLIANRLGRIAHEILRQRMGGKSRSYFDPLAGPDWTPGAPIQEYLESGLKGSFADQPRPRRLFPKPVPSPLDHKVDEVIEFLEAQAGDQ